MAETVPQFDETTITLASGILKIERIKPSDKSIYIQKIEVNGKEWKSVFIDHNTLIKGGTITIVLGEEPYSL